MNIKSKHTSVFSIVFVATFLVIPIGVLFAESADYCANLSGSAKGLCIAATHGANCQEAEPSATAQACGRLETKFREITGGSEPPWITDCPCPANETIDQLFTGFTDNLVCAINDKQFAIYTSDSSRAFEASKLDTGSFYCLVRKDLALVDLIYIDDESIVDDCIRDAKRVAAAYIGTPVTDELYGGVCGEL